MSTVDLTLGALEVSVLISTALYGMVTVQAFLYTEKSAKDPVWFRIMVGSTWTLETVHTILLWLVIYSLTVTDYGRPSTINDPRWTLALVNPLTSFIGSIVQIFFAYRLRVLSGRLIIPIIAWGGALLRCALGIMAGVVLGTAETLQSFLDKYQWLVTTLFVLSATLDVLNASAMCYYLLIRRRSGFKTTQRMVDKLLMFTIETGVATWFRVPSFQLTQEKTNVQLSLCAFAVLITELIMHNNFVDFAIFMIYPKLYSISLFTSLNARQTLRQTGSDTGLIRSSEHFSQPRSDVELRSVTLELSQTQPGHAKARMME